MRAFYERRSVATLFFGVVIYAATVLAEYRVGDVVPMSYKCSLQERDLSWDEPSLRSQMPQFGRTSTVRFTPVLTEVSPFGTKVAIAFAFEHERFVMPRITATEGSEGKHLSRLTLTFVYSAGEIVRVRFDDAYATTANSEEVSFDIEYRWDRLPEEDEQAGMSLIFLVSLIATAILAIDVCNSVGDENVAVSRRGQNGSEAKLSSGYNGGMRIRDEPWQR